MVNSEDFANRLQEIMDYYSLTSSGLADAIDFNRSSISHLLSGRNKPSLEFVMKILETFPEVKLYWLLNGNGNFPEIDDTIKDNLAERSSKTSSEDKALNKEETHSSTLPALSEEAAIERVLIFFKDGSFKEYKN